MRFISSCNPNDVADAVVPEKEEEGAVVGVTVTRLVIVV